MSSRPFNSPCPRRGFTLLEMVVSMAILMVLLVAMGSVLVFSTRVTSGQGATDQINQLAAADAADQISDDLGMAMNFSERTSTSLTFTVPDRVSNGTPNQIRYAWTGSGQPLTRQFCPSNTTLLNASSTTYPPVTLLSNVTSLSFNPLFRSMGTAAVSDFSIASTSNGLLGTANTYNINSTNWLRQTFTPSLPSGSTSYTITRIQVAIEASGPQDCTLFLQVSGTNTSGSTITETEPLFEVAMSASKAEYVEVPFKSLTGLSPSSVVTMTLGFTSGTAIGGTASYETTVSLGGILTGATWSTTSNSGSSWSLASALSCLQFNAFGTTP